MVAGRTYIRAGALIIGHAFNASARIAALGFAFSLNFEQLLFRYRILRRKFVILVFQGAFNNVGLFIPLFVGINELAAQINGVCVYG